MANISSVTMEARKTVGAIFKFWKERKSCDNLACYIKFKMSFKSHDKIKTISDKIRGNLLPAELHLKKC